MGILTHDDKAWLRRHIVRPIYALVRGEEFILATQQEVIDALNQIGVDATQLKADFDGLLERLQSEPISDEVLAQAQAIEAQLESIHAAVASGTGTADAPPEEPPVEEPTVEPDVPVEEPPAEEAPAE